LCRGVSDCKICYKPRTNIVRDEKGYLFTDSHSILARWRNHVSQLFNVHEVNDKTEIHTAEPLVPDPSVFELEMTIKNLKDTNNQVLIKSQQR
jgi:hypothetical protein